MHRDELELLIPDHVAGHLDESTRREVERALQQFPELLRYHDRVTRLYAHDLDIARVRPMPGPSSRNRWRAAAAAAAVILILLRAYSWAGPTEKIHEVAAADTPPSPPILVDLPELPDHDGSTGWAADALEARMISEFTGKPMLAVYSFPPCPRCRAMDPLLDSPTMQDMLSGFARYRVEFTEQIPPSLAMRQFEVDNSIVLHLPAIVITSDGVDFDTLYDIDELADVDLHVARFRHERAPRNEVLEGEPFRHVRDLLAGIPARLAAGEAPSVLADLERVEALASPSGSRFADVARGIREDVERQVGR